ncbi:hypothetical protein DKX38_009759 [Salix brachista]|uniref:Pectinesterase n=1 Tax=Salix brachista TaxID=2182728 RepID=A0A5N5MBJ0_9ROSI|nr:hypothetical protein DKX38_009759 [Salix brachista]
MSKLLAPTLFLFVLTFSLPVWPAAHASSTTAYLQNECLKVPVHQFVGSLTNTLDIIRDVTSVISNFGNIFGDSRLTNAITDCLDLLDFSADELSWSMSASQNPKGKELLPLLPSICHISLLPWKDRGDLIFTMENSSFSGLVLIFIIFAGKHNSTGDLSSDLRTWLSAALVNQDTCIEGLDGSSSILKGLVSGGLNQITSSVQQLLKNVDPRTTSKSSEGGYSGSKSGNKNQFPSWVKHEDRKLLVLNGVTSDVIVAADGTGNFTKIMDAVTAAPDYSMHRHIIYIKKGVYNEYVDIKKKKWNLMMVGEGMGATIITGNRNFIDGWTTFRSATFAVSGRGFIARDITFENTAGPSKHQAVALRSDSDLSVLFRCEIKGYQDSLYTHTMRQFYRECRVSGTVDFIFGDATAVFQNCQILARKGLPNQKNTITAHGRKDPSQPTGYSIQFCNISADIDLLPYVNSTYTYLGRPWKNFSRTIIMQSHMSNAISPEGWLEWNGNVYLDTLYYGEYINYGPGAGLGRRVKWPGYHLMNDSTQASNFTVANFIEGNLWLPSTGVRYTAGFEV